MLSLWTFCSSKNPLKQYVFHKNIKQHSCFKNNNNQKWFLSSKSAYISEGSCDTEDWSNDAENSALITEINYILTYIQIQNSSCNIISEYFCFYCISDQILYMQPWWAENTFLYV